MEWWKDKTMIVFLWLKYNGLSQYPAHQIMYPLTDVIITIIVQESTRFSLEDRQIWYCQQQSFDYVSFTAGSIVLLYSCPL